MGVAAGALDESEVANLPRFALGAKAGVCIGDSRGGASRSQWRTPTSVEYVDGTTGDCLAIGDHGGYADTFSPFKMSKIACDTEEWILCASSVAPSVSHGDKPKVLKEFKSSNVDLVKAAFAIKNGPTTAAPTTTAAATTTAATTSAPAAANNNTRNIVIVVVVVVIAAVAFMMMKKD